MAISIDLHTHAKVSKSLRFRFEDFQLMIESAAKGGLDGFASTEHIHSFDFWDMVDELTSKFSYHDGRLEVGNGMTVLSGAEIDVAEGGHVLAIGPYEALWELDKRFLPRLNQGFFPPVKALIRYCRDLGMVLIGAHPTRPGKVLAAVGDATLSTLDALELNGRDVGHDLPVHKVAERAQRLGLPTVGSSDAHVWPQIGLQRTITPMKELTLEGLRATLENHDTQVRTMPNIREIVRLCKRHKTLIKANHMDRAQRLMKNMGRLTEHAHLSAAAPALA